MLGALCRGFGTEPNSTYLRRYLHGNPAAESLYSSLHPFQLALPVPLAPPHFPFPTPYPKPRLLKSNTCSYINFDQSKAVICLAGETVTYWCRLGFSQEKKARLPVSENVSGVTQTFTPHFYISFCITYIQEFLALLI